MASSISLRLKCRNDELKLNSLQRLAITKTNKLSGKLNHLGLPKFGSGLYLVVSPYEGHVHKIYNELLSMDIFGWGALAMK